MSKEQLVSGTQCNNITYPSGFFVAFRRLRGVPSLRKSPFGFTGTVSGDGTHNPVSVHQSYPFGCFDLGVAYVPSSSILGSDAGVMVLKYRSRYLW